MSKTEYKQLRIRLEVREHEMVQQYADDCGVSISEYIRKILRKEPLIQRPTQNAVEHFWAIQDFKEKLMACFSSLPKEEGAQILRSLDELLLQSKRLI